MGIKSNNKAESYFNFFGSSYGIADAAGGSPTPAPFSATGGNQSDSAGFTGPNGYQLQFIF